MGIKTILTCDTCGATLELDGPYHIIKEEMRVESWRNVKVDDKWKIKCGKCRGEK